MEDQGEYYFTGECSMDVVEKEEDPTVCDICLSGDVYENNEILFCDKCDVAVHQLCYGVKEVPQDAWFCYPCADGIDPKTLTCELCPHTGGAYKYTDKAGKWAHSICANWIPELYEVHDPKKPVYINLKYLDPKRTKLRCAICNKKGACVQCAYGRCSVSIHSWCALRNSSAGCTRRIVKDPDGDGSNWEIFCKTHATAVTDPIKVKKSKQSSYRYEEPEEEIVTKKDRHSDAAGKSLSHSLDNLRLYNNNSAATFNGKKLLSSFMDTYKSDSDEGSENDDDDDDEENRTTFPIISFLEWPGMAEGEGMDGEHFMNNVSAYYAEDHSRKWLDFMMRDFIRPTNWNPKTHPVYTWNCKNVGKAALMELLDDIVVPNTTFTEAKSKEATSHVKRKELLEKVEHIIDTLRITKTDNNGGIISNGQSSSTANTSDDGQSQTEELSGKKHSQSEEQPNTEPNHNHPTVEVNIFDPIENMLVTSRDASANNSTLKEIIESRDENDMMTIRAIFDGEQHRMACKFAVKYPYSPSEETSSPSLPVNSDKEQWHVVDLSSSTSCLPPSSYEELKSMVINPSSNPIVAASDLLGDSENHHQYAALKLTEFAPLPDDAEVPLHDRTILSKSDDNEVAHAIATDQQAYGMLMNTIYTRIDHFLTDTNLLTNASYLKDMKPQWKRVNKLYKKQQAWKRIGLCLQKGMKDQTPDFNKVILAPTPASWVVGRPKVEEDEPEPHEDAVCMCCFDGGSDDHNKILFCDGCNAAMHQVCYGIPEVPEGDYYCDRCLFLQRMGNQFLDDEIDDYDIKNSVTCLLCPLHHGGLKKTKCGYWVHMSCALWANGTLIDDLVTIRSIDISQVPRKQLMLPRSGRLATTGTGTTSSSSTMTEPICEFCKYQGGYLASCCSHEISASPCCQTKFHPLCAWFEGAFIQAQVTDPTFQGLEREGKYPSGIKYTFMCKEHSESYRMEQVYGQGLNRALLCQGLGHSAGGEVAHTKEEQCQIRSKYRIQEKDLMHIPGRKKKRVKKDKPVKANANEAVRKGATSAIVQSRLTMDGYQDKCAICLKPTNLTDVFGNTYDGLTFGGQLPELVIPDFEAELSMSTPVNVMPNVAVPLSGDHNTSEGIAPVVLFGEEPLLTAITTHSSSSVDAVAGSGGSAATAISSITAPSIAAPTVPHEALVPAAINPHQILKCAKCNISVHRGCLTGLETLPAGNVNAWRCQACTESTEKELECIICPRRGGYFRQATDPDGEQAWAHIYCVRHTHCHGSIKENGDIEMRNLSKPMNKKHKCSICNRKQGQCVQCNALGCSTYFHPLCVARSNKGYVSSRYNASSVFCSEHIPPGVEFVEPPGIWVDVNEIIRLQIGFERARLILDSMRKREKCKKNLNKVEHELFNSKFKKLLVRACKGNSSVGKNVNSMLLALGLGTLSGNGKNIDMSLLEEGAAGSEFETDDDEDEDDEESDIDDPDAHQFIPFTELYEDYAEIQPNTESGFVEDGQMDATARAALKAETRKRKKKVKKLEPAIMVKAEGHEEEFRISGAWHRRGDIRPPKTLRIGFSGITISKREAYADRFKSRMTEQIIRNEDESRIGLKIFKGTKHAITYGKQLGSVLINEMQKSDQEFQQQLTDLGFDFPLVITRKTKRETGRKSVAPAATVAPIVVASEVREDAMPPATGSKRGRPSLKDAVALKDDKKTPAKGAAAAEVEVAQIEEEEALGQKKKKRKSLGNDGEAEVAATAQPVLPPGQWLENAEKENRQLISFASGLSSVKELLRLLPGTTTAASSSSSSSSSAAASGGRGRRRQSLPSSSHEEGARHLVDDCISQLSPWNENSWNPLEWRQYDLNELYQLERIIQVILTNITQYRIHDAPVANKKAASDIQGNESPTKKKRSSSSADLSLIQEANEKTEEGRSIEDDFEDAPLDLIPGYQNCVRRIVTLSTIRKTLTLHGYRSLGAFTLDFFVMLNNARIVTLSTSQTWKDTKLFAKLFEEYKRQVFNDPTNIPIRSSLDWKLTVEPYVGDENDEDESFSLPAAPSIGATSTRSGGSGKGKKKRKGEKVRIEKIDQKMYCGGCRGKFVAKPWPSTFQFPENSVSRKPNGVPCTIPTSPLRKSTRLSFASPSGGSSADSGPTKYQRIAINMVDEEWQWLCGDCLLGYGEELCGFEVQVWWHGDACVYDGIFNAYDEASHCHRVLYNDDEWEFANFAQEVFMIRPKPSDAR